MREVLSGIIGTWSQAKTTGEVRSIAAMWRCGRSSMVIVDLGKFSCKNNGEAFWFYVGCYGGNNDFNFREVGEDASETAKGATRQVPGWPGSSGGGGR